MLFALSATGKPSVAKWIVVGAERSGGRCRHRLGRRRPRAKDRRAPGSCGLSASRRLNRALKRGLRVRIRTDEGGTATVKVTVSRATARKLALKRRAKGRVRVARAKKVVPRGRSTVVVRFDARPRKAMRKVRRVTLRIRVAITDAAGNTSRRAKTVTLKR